MKKAEDIKEFIERIDAAKKINPKDLSSDQDLTIAIMNLISIEEHLVFSGAKTEKTSFYDMVENIRELRKTLMQKIIPQYEGEVWCISKHLLSSSMRLMEVGTKQQSLGNKEEAYQLFSRSYELYCLFWGLNMNILDTTDLKWIEDKRGESLPERQDRFPEEKAESVFDVEPKKEGALEKMKAFVKKAVDCCIE